MDLDFAPLTVCDAMPDEYPATDGPFPVGSSNALLRAHATLVAGCLFVATQARLEAIAATDHPAHARMTGNRLHELDRFLSVLIDEVATLQGLPSEDTHFFFRMRNTPEKLRRLKAGSTACRESGQRLRAVGRISAYLRYCRDGLPRPRLARDIGIAAGEGVCETMACSAVGPSLMISITGLYRAIGNRLLASVDNAAS